MERIGNIMKGQEGGGRNGAGRMTGKRAMAR
jgi:hypothetical protein